MGMTEGLGPDAVRLAAGFPLSLALRVEKVLQVLPGPAGFPTSRRSALDASVDGERVAIPARMYFAEPGPSAVAALSEVERTILGCVYTRHHDGWVRQRALQAVVDSAEAWVVPFVVQLIGEYVIEILDDIWTALIDVVVTDPSRQDRYRRFVEENPAAMALTSARVMSYWNCYYRHRFPDRTNYVGHRLIAVLKNLPAVPPLTDSKR